MYTEAHFVNTLDTLQAFQLTALVDLAENIDYWWRLFGGNGVILEGLWQRGLLYDCWKTAEQVRAAQKVEPDMVFTPYGHAFLAWYRSPRDVPQQEVLL
jgi:hypothetical protein